MARPTPFRRAWTLAANLLLIGWFAGAWFALFIHHRPDHDLERVRFFDRFEGVRGAAELLAREGVAVTDRRFDSFAEAYLDCPLPVFVTADSAWDAYHNLFEEGLRQLDEAQGPRLREFSARLVQAAQIRNSVQPGWWHDALKFAAVGLRLQDPSATVAMDEPHRGEVDQTLGQLEEGAGWVQVPFLAMPINGHRFPGDRYASLPRAQQRYHAARQWYSMCLFAASSPRETAVAARLATLIQDDESLRALYDELVKPAADLLGEPDGCGPREYAELARSVGLDGDWAGESPVKLAELCRKAAKLAGPRCNDTFVLPNELARSPGWIKGFRLMPPPRLGSEGYLQRTVVPHVRRRHYPCGTDLFANGPLTCTLGWDIVRGYDWRIAKAMSKLPPYQLNGSIRDKALLLSTRLQRPLPKTAPQSLRDETWSAKQMWTQMAIWADVQHTPAAVGRQTIVLPAGAKPPGGYVSPCPLFFDGLAELARESADIFANAIPTRRLDVAAMLREFAGLSDSLAAIARKQLAGEPIGEADRDLLANYGLILARLAGDDWGEREICDKAGDGPVGIGTLGGVCAGSRNGKPGDGGVVHTGGQAARATRRSCHPTFTGGQAVRASHAPLGRTGRVVVRVRPPRCCALFVNPYENRTLYGGVGRPEAIYVIVAGPDGRETLHRGAVLSYREFRRPSNLLFNDDAWAEQLSKPHPMTRPPGFTYVFRNVSRKIEPEKSI